MTKINTSRLTEKWTVPAPPSFPPTAPALPPLSLPGLGLGFTGFLVVVVGGAVVAEMRKKRGNT